MCLTNLIHSIYLFRFNTPVKKVARYPEKLLAPSVFSTEVPFYKMHSGIKVTEGKILIIFHLKINTVKLVYNGKIHSLG